MLHVIKIHVFKPELFYTTLAKYFNAKLYYKMNKLSQENSVYKTLFP